jgi:hypothetical protein
MILPNTNGRERQPEDWMNKKLQTCLFISDPECRVRLIHITDIFYDINAYTDKGYIPLYPEVRNRNLSDLCFHTFSVCACVNGLQYSQRVLNDLYRTRLSLRRMIWLLPHLPSPSVSSTGDTQED